MTEQAPAYGLWGLVVLNSIIFILFAFTFFKPQTKRDWRSFGAFSGFLVALFAEMYGFPLSIYTSPDGCRADTSPTRGSLINSRALIQALRSGKVAGSGLDVLPDEPLIREEAELICGIYCNQHDLRELVASHVLLRMRKVVITPHSAFNTREAVTRIIETTVGNIRAFTEGHPENVVTRRNLVSIQPSLG